MVLSRSASAPTVSIVTTFPRLSTNQKTFFRNFRIVLGLVDKWEVIHFQFHRDTSLRGVVDFRSALHLPAPNLISFAIDRDGGGMEPELPSAFGSAWLATPLRRLHLRCPEVRTFVPIYSNRLTELTHLLLDGSCFHAGTLEPGSGTAGLKLLPTRLAGLLRPMGGLLSVTLKGMVHWREPTIRIASDSDTEDEGIDDSIYNRDLKAKCPVVELSKLVYFELHDEFFASARLLALLAIPRDDTCQIRVYSYTSKPRYWTHESLLPRLRDFFRTSPRRSGPFKLSLGLGPMLMLQYEDAAGNRSYDLRLDIIDIDCSPTLDRLCDTYSQLLLPFIVPWDLAATRILRLHTAGIEYSSFLDGGLSKVCEALIAKCTAVTELHLYGMSMAVHHLLNGSYMSSSLHVYEALPFLEKIVVIASSFNTPDFSDHTFLSKVMVNRLEKRTAVSQVRELVIVDDTIESGMDESSIVEQFQRHMDSRLPVMLKGIGYSDYSLQEGLCHPQCSRGFWFVSPGPCWEESALPWCGC
ncbi:hypothetical protein CC2G_008281 [Coprinopsis cinerea AmutBmut pab1-1]|nr:hypothetical protein CC2G_008281 [Coprinopsis cinerea AmutBmut pab1-1]